MKFRYLKIFGGTVWGTNDLTREDLAKLKSKMYEAILDLEQMKMFNAEENRWDDIPGDE